jgi:uncharacterized membrane protein
MVVTPLRRLGSAALIGVVCGMRTFTGPAALALRGRVAGAPARLLLTAVAAGEAVGDKTPVVPARTSAPSLAARVLSGALSGRALAGAPGVAPGALGALAGTFGAYHVRAALTGRTGLPDALFGVAEDALAVAAAALATR